MRVSVGYVLCLLTAALGAAQAQDMKPPEENPVALYKGLGAWHHPIAARNPEVQKYFDQGLAMATGPYINMGTEGDGDLDSKAACRAVEAGLKIPDTAPRERAYLEAAATRCPEYKPDVYVAAMKSLAKRYPDDLAAATFYAESLMVPVRWHWYSHDGEPAAGVLEAERVLEQVLRRWPEHPGANHYYIHAVESSPTPERAVPSAQRLMGVVPWAGHMVHMPAHIWLVLGEYELAASVNERAAQVDREYFAQSHVMGAYNMYYVHNLHFVTYARSMQGHRTETVQAAREMAEAILPAADRSEERGVGNAGG